MEESGGGGRGGGGERGEEWKDGGVGERGAGAGGGRGLLRWRRKGCRGGGVLEEKGRRGRWRRKGSGGVGINAKLQR